ncbi:MAG TPA: nitrilase-related carbon-nitrogen hydrolase [Spirochaetota bacterium]|nr:nitrilase-related carbon-nitrogen hydrolase [Spirochaetota bacterium]HPQ53430.1 nitrilase-related carbon-nitrogen hydrolase [Spirochaetota bacterium]
MSKTITIAAVSQKSLFGNITENIRSTENWSRTAKSMGADIVCFPELNISGYSLSHDNESVAETIPGPITDEIIRIAHNINICIIAGLVEKTGEGPAITQVAVSPGGILGTYRKVHLSPPEKDVFVSGSSFPLMTYREITFGIGLCFDAHFPEQSTIYALQGADIIFFPHASPRPESAREKRDRWLRYLPARSYDNSVYTVVCNQVGDTSNGNVFRAVNLILGLKGEILAEAYGDNEEITVYTLPCDKLQEIRESRMGHFLSNRSPHLYAEILKIKTNT